MSMKMGQGDMKTAKKILANSFLLLAVGLWYLYGKDDRELKKEEKHRKQQMNSRLSGDSLQDELCFWRQE